MSNKKTSKGRGADNQTCFEYLVSEYMFSWLKSKHTILCVKGRAWLSAVGLFVVSYKQSFKSYISMLYSHSLTAICDAKFGVHK